MGGGGFRGLENGGGGKEGAETEGGGRQMRAHR